MTLMLGDNISGKPLLSARKIGLLSIPVAIAILMMQCGKKVNEILAEREAQRTQEDQISNDKNAEINASWNETREDQVLKIYRIQKGDTLTSIARKNGVTLESILKVNPKITSANSISAGHMIVIPYDGTENAPPSTMQTSGTPVPLAFSKESLLTMMKDVLIRPEGRLIGAIGDQPSDTARLKTIAEKVGFRNDSPKDVRYANLCAANVRAVGTSLKYYLQESGIDMDLGWTKGKNGIGVGHYFADLSTHNQLPKGYQVITTKNNPDPAKLKQVLLEKGKEYSVFILSYSHEVDGHVNIAFRVGDDIIIFDPSWKGRSSGWPERFHKFEDYMDHFVLGEKTPGYNKQSNRYDLYNVTCVPAHRIDVVKTVAKKSLPEKAQRDDGDMRGLTMVFEGFTPRMKIDTHEKGEAITYAIGYGTNIGSLKSEYPFGSYGKDMADYFKKRGHSTETIKEIMHGKREISRSNAQELFEMRYVPRYQKMRTICGKNWSKYPPVIRNMLVDMSYNMGEFSIFPNGKNPGFPDAVAALNRGDWAGFINAVVDSKYAGDVGARRLGKWIALIVRDVLKGKTAGLSREALNMLSTYTTKHSKDLNREIAKK